MLGSELHCCYESKSSISSILLSVLYFYLHVCKCVRGAEETPSHLILLLWKPLMTKDPAANGLNHVNGVCLCIHTSSIMPNMTEQRSKNHNQWQICLLKSLHVIDEFSQDELYFQITYSILWWLCPYDIIVTSVFVIITLNRICPKSQISIFQISNKRLFYGPVFPQSQNIFHHIKKYAIS